MSTNISSTVCCSNNDNNCCFSTSTGTNNEYDDDNNNISDHPKVFKTKRISSVSGYDVQRLLYKIQRAQMHLPSLQSIPYIDYYIPKSTISSKTTTNNLNHHHKNNYNTNQPPKHIGQIISIVSHMISNGLLPLSCLRQDQQDYHTLKDERQDDPSNSNRCINQSSSYYFIEFGCGTAKLSDHVGFTIFQKHLKQRSVQPCTYNYILIDQQPMKAVERYCDGRIRARQQEQHSTLESSSSNNNTTINVQRYTKPISCIQLYDIIHSNNDDYINQHQSNDDSEFTKEQQQCKIIAMAKHLCGSATDDAIQCIQQYHHDERQRNINHHRSTNNCSKDSLRQQNVPLVIATCCHYGCNVSTFLSSTTHDNNHSQQDTESVTTAHSVGTLSYLQYLGFDERDIEVLMIVSQWTSIKKEIDEMDNKLSCKETYIKQQEIGDEFPPRLPSQPISVAIDDNDIIERMKDKSSEFEKKFTRQEKYELGQFSKIILDTARAYYLKNHCHYDKVQLVHFTNLSIERNLIIAT